MTRARDISRLLGRTDNELDGENDALIGTAGGIVDSAFVLAQTPEAAGFTFYSTLDSLPSNADQGSLAFVEANTRMYLNDGDGWYSIAAVNLSPSMTLSPSGTITLASDGTPSTVTITATDTDDPAAILSYSVESDGNMKATGTTVTQDSSIFTIDPLTSAQGGVAGNFTLSFKVSDQIDEAVANKSFSISFSSVDGFSWSGQNLYRNTSASPTITATLNTTGYANGTNIPYTITGLTSQDITTPLSGNMVVGSQFTITAASGNRMRSDQTGTLTCGGVSTTFNVKTLAAQEGGSPFDNYGGPYLLKRDGTYAFSDATNSAVITMGLIGTARYKAGVNERVIDFFRGAPNASATNYMYTGNAGIAPDADYYGDFRAIKIYGVKNGTPVHTHTFTWARNCGRMGASGAQGTYRYATLGSRHATANYCTRTYTHPDYSGVTCPYGFAFIEFYSNAAATSLINTSFWNGVGGYLV